MASLTWNTVLLFFLAALLLVVFLIVVIFDIIFLFLFVTDISGDGRVSIGSQARQLLDEVRWTEQHQMA